MSFLEIGLLTLLITSMVLLGAVLIYYMFFRAYTREKFAFRVFLLITSLCTSLIFMLSASKHTIMAALNMGARYIGLGPLDYEPAMSDKILAVILIFGLIHLALNLHRNWPGAISVREHDAKLAGIEPGVVGGAMAAISEYAGKVKLDAYAAAQDPGSPADVVAAPSETKAWHFG